jgi:hypothetical protein
VTLPTASFWSKLFWSAVKNNLIFVCVHMAVQNQSGSRLPDSCVCMGPRRVRGLYRTIIFLPTTLSVIIVGFSWNLILSPLWRRKGRFEAVLARDACSPWLGLPSTALVTASVDVGLAICRHSPLRREVEGLGQSACRAGGDKELASRRSHASNSFFFRPRNGAFQPKDCGA